MALFKLYIDPGHGGHDPGGIGNGLEEEDIALAIGLKIREILSNEYVDVAVKMSRTNDVFRTLNERTNEANSWGAHFFLSVHTNAFNSVADGFESYIYPGVGASTKTYQQIIHNEIAKVDEMDDRGMKEKNLHVLRESNMPAILTENGFIDNASDASKMKKITWINNVARAHVNGVAKAFNLKGKVIIPVKQPSSGMIYRVQVGAFGSSKNAQVLVNELKNDGFSSYYFSEGGLYKVQSGAYSVYTNAREQVDRLKAKGYTGAWITQ